MGEVRQDKTQANRFQVIREARGSQIVLEAVYDAPAELSIQFGDWLFNIRTALDYAFFQLAIEDTGKNPPTRQGARMFPIKRTKEDFDALQGTDTLHGLKESTVNMVEAMQPYHTKYGADGNALLWLHDLARRDRHRQPLTMGAIIKTFRAKLHGLPNARCLDFDQIDPTKVPAVVGAGETLSLATARCASERDARRLEGRVEVWIDNDLEVLEWYRETFTKGTSRNIRNDTLEERMKFVEYYMGLVLDHFEQGIGR